MHLFCNGANPRRSESCILPAPDNHPATWFHATYQTMSCCLARSPSFKLRIPVSTKQFEAFTWQCFLAVLGSFNFPSLQLHRFWPCARPHSVHVFPLIHSSMNICRMSDNCRKLLPSAWCISPLRRHSSILTCSCFLLANQQTLSRLQ